MGGTDYNARALDSRGARGRLAPTMERRPLSGIPSTRSGQHRVPETSGSARAFASGEGVTIGDGTVVAAGARVAKHVESRAIAGSVARQKIKYRFQPTMIERFVRSRWWDHCDPVFRDFRTDGRLDFSM
jgi:hypothetical protein